VKVVESGEKYHTEKTHPYYERIHSRGYMFLAFFYSFHSIHLGNLIELPTITFCEREGKRNV